MKRWSGVSAVIVFASLLAMGAGPLPAASGDGVTTGDLALRLARAAGISLPAIDSQQAALGSLRKAGINLGGDPKALVTEKVLVQVGQSLWVRVRSVHPDAPATDAMCSAFILSFRGALQGRAGSPGHSETDAGHAACQGRESRDGRQGTPASPADPSATDPPCEPGS